MAKFFRTILIGLCLSGLGSLGIAQQQQPPTPGATESFRPNYILGPGDQIVIRIADAPDVSDRPFRIDDEGNVTLPLVGKFRVAGLNLEQLEAELVTRFKTVLVNPQLSVSIGQYRAEPVFLVGAFRNPGIHPLQGRRTLVETLAAAGGFQPNAGRRIRITRRKEIGPIPLPNTKEDAAAGTTSVDIPLSSLRESVNPAEDIVLQPFDVISIDRAEAIYISGDIARVGSLELGERDSLSVTQAVALSGGLTASASKKVRILRPVLDTAKRAEIEVDLDRVMKGEVNDFPLLPNDILFVPRSPRYFLGRAASVALALTIPIVTALAITR